MSQGRIPQDVLDRITYCCGRQTDEGGVFHDVLRSYQERVGHPNEPILRARLADLYCRIVCAEDDKLLKPEEHRALELCAQGAAYTEHESPPSAP